LMFTLIGCFVKRITSNCCVASAMTRSLWRNGVLEPRKERNLMEKFETFNNIDNLLLRVYNRTVLVFNLQSDVGKSAAVKYLDQFNAKEKTQIFIMSKLIKEKGADNVKKSVMSSVQPEGYVGV